MAKQSQSSNKDLLEDLRSERLLDVKTVSEILEISPTTIYRLLKNGQLEYVRVGAKKGYRIPKSALKRFIEERLAKIKLI